MSCSITSIQKNKINAVIETQKSTRWEATLSFLQALAIKAVINMAIDVIRTFNQSINK